LNNYQYVASPANNTDNLGARVMRNLGKNDRLAYHLTYQRRDSEQSQPFAFLDTLSGYGIQTDLTWTHNFSPTTILSSQLSFNRNRNETTPFFANGVDVATELGIAGTSSNPIDYGPPNLNFTNFGALSDANPILTRNQSQALTESVILSRGKHTLTYGLQYTPQRSEYPDAAERARELQLHRPGHQRVGEWRCGYGNGLRFRGLPAGPAAIRLHPIQRYQHVLRAEYLDRLRSGRLGKWVRI
jgi:hypothetical protein